MTDLTRPVPIETLLAHREWVRALARHLLRDETAVDDVEQDTWLAALRRPPRREETARAWLSQVVRNQVRGRRRAQRRRDSHERRAPGGDAVRSTADLVAEAEAHKQVVLVVMDLDEPYRTTVLYRFFERLAPGEVAARMGVPVETVRTRTRRALERLRRNMLAAGPSERGDGRGALLLLAGRPDQLPAPGPAGSAGLTGGVVAMSAGKKVLGVVLVLLAIGAGAMLFANRGAPSEETDGDRVAAEPAPADAPTRVSRTGPAAPDVPAPPTVHRVRGRVVDQTGASLGGVSLVVETRVPGTDAPSDERTVVGDAKGAFDVVFDDAREVRLVTERVPGIRPAKEPAPWLATPADEVIVVAQRLHTAELVLRVVDGSTGDPIPEFQCVIRGADGMVMTAVAAGGAVEREFEFPVDIESYRLQVTLIQPRAPGGARTVDLTPGAEVVVELTLDRKAGVSGRVVGADGQPVSGAVVYFGDQMRARGDEPFKPFQVRRIRDGVETDEEGRFELPGEGVIVTVIHPDFSVVSVAPDAVDEIRLPALGALRGRLIGVDGAPVTEGEIAMDRIAKTRLDAQGRFAYDRVRAGIRGLVLPGKRYVGVIVEPGEETEIELSQWLPSLRLDARYLVPPGSKPLVAVAIGLETPFSMLGTRLGAEPVTFENAIPGRYVLLVQGGLLATFGAHGAEADLDPPVGDLTVTAKPGTRVYVVPKTDMDIVHLMGGRVASLTVPASGEVLFDQLPEGDYHVGVERRGALVEVRVEGPGATVALP